VALSTGASTGEYEAMAAGAIEECDRLLDMINTMLLISKTESGVYKLTREEVDLAALTAKACELFEPAAHDKGVGISCHAPVSCPLGADRQMLQRMIANLLDNAVKFTPSGGTVEVTVRENERQEFVVAVKDTGTGISDIDMPRIFDRFYHCDQSRSQPGTGLGGTGLGLSLARAVAHAHGGDITVASTPGHGSAFSAVIPKKGSS
jgi:signal transduction histidine kinase